ncbi:cell-envelope stress modulator CpxP [Lonsdalea quercina]|uniref:cell-envelope stress modulator CpxP n=1 Tax=Lonsdalea quercina TaxID=71657 RepID=UPI0039765A2D
MRRTTLLSLASLLLLGFSIVKAADAEGLGMEELTQNDSATKRIPSQQRMFDGVKLTEQQRQQMRDLMQEVRHDMPPYSAQDVETMYQLVIAEKFDEAAVRAQINKMTQAQIARQVEMARVRNQMYSLLTPEQKEVLRHKHEQHMEVIREQISVANQQEKYFSVPK